ncbi:CPBP family glutamic-type intramembrane protease [Acaryochloris sp. IP29b_bin.148]|uniref:CPBP family glutamic-type intramembrane protease n=1 Tax=Acaryochloris sp. IP29b_bin.148 TaxID=2969218 RepID=UPI002611A4D6|nr:CPBP family glutamic-type intramembrane protease [Acaryochloris sp. IP29b_bin.148]
MRFNRVRNRYQWAFSLIAVTFCLGWGLLHPDRTTLSAEPQTAPTLQASNIEDSLYRPMGQWVGRLILPPQADNTDWVWFEVYHSPLTDFVGQTVRLQWQDNPDVQAQVKRVQQDVKLSAEAHQSREKGNIHPHRLDGRQQVGPLQSLAGARPTDDILVRLKQVQVETSPTPHLKLAEDPVQVPGIDYGLVKVLGPVPTTQSVPKQCPGPSPCPSELTRVRHYNPNTRRFNGPEEVVHIRQDQPNSAGVFQSTPRKLASSPAGKAGWYIYGSKNAEGIFEVSAIAPRSLFQLQPDYHFSSTSAGKHYFKRKVWQQTAQHKGKLQRAIVDHPFRKHQAAIDQWQVGDQALVVHLFGGIGGKKAEPQAVIGTVTGHFGYGIATVIQDPFTGEPQFEVEYQQVYAHNPEGIVAGPTHWAEYMGHLNRGWLGSRPVLDVLVKSEALTQPYQFGEIVIDPLSALKMQLQLMAARYRIGDGTGSALVTPAKSCVQDSSQAVYQTIKRIQYQVQRSPAIQTWLTEHPQDPQTQRFQELTTLGNALERELVPLGIVRRDWQQNAQVAAGIASPETFSHADDFIAQILSWRTLIPRVAQDQIIRIFLNQGTPLWFLNTNQVGGWNPGISPLAPTELFGQWPLLSFSFSRLVEATTTLPTPRGWLVSGLILGGYGLIALGWGTQVGFLSSPQFSAYSRSVQLRVWIGSLIMPALVEELLFRSLLIPHPQEGVWEVTVLLWSGLSLMLFVLYHPLNARTFYKAGDPTFFNPTFLTLATLLGIACTCTYLLTGSIWPGTIMHWLVVAIWLLYLGGQERLSNTEAKSKP